MNPSAGWRGEAMLAIGLAAMAGRTGDNRLHRHHAVQLVVAGEAPVRLETADGSCIEGGIIGCAAHTSHRLLPSDDAVVVYVDPASDLGRLLMTALRFSAVISATTQPDLHARLRAAVRRTSSADIERILRDLLHSNAPPRSADLDARVRRVLALGASGALQPSLREAAAICALSPSRFSHLFVAETGVAYRTFLKWHRLLTAIHGAAAGGDLTTVAHQAGFADSAHFSRTFTAMFGVAPSRAFAGLDFDTPRKSRSTAHPA